MSDLHTVEEYRNTHAASSPYRPVFWYLVDNSGTLSVDDAVGALQDNEAVTISWGPNNAADVCFFPGTSSQMRFYVVFGDRDVSLAELEIMAIEVADEVDLRPLDVGHALYRADRPDLDDFLRRGRQRQDRERNPPPMHISTPEPNVDRDYQTLTSLSREFSTPSDPQQPSSQPTETVEAERDHSIELIEDTNLHDTVDLETHLAAVDATDRRGDAYGEILEYIDNGESVSVAIALPSREIGMIEYDTPETSDSLLAELCEVVGYSLSEIEQITGETVALRQDEGSGWSIDVSTTDQYHHTQSVSSASGAGTIRLGTVFFVISLGISIMSGLSIPALVVSGFTQYVGWAAISMTVFLLLAVLFESDGS